MTGTEKSFVLQTLLGIHNRGVVTFANTVENDPTSSESNKSLARQCKKEAQDIIELVKGMIINFD